MFFSGTERQMVDALSKLHDFFLSSHVRAKSETEPLISPDFDRENNKYKGSRSLNDLRPEVGTSPPRPSIRENGS